MLHIEPADEAISLEQGEHVVAVLSLGRRHEDLDAIAKPEQPPQPRPVAYQGIEGVQRPDPGRRRGRVLEPFENVAGREGGAALRAIGRLDQDPGDRPAHLPVTPGLGFGGAQRAPERRQLARRREAEPRQGASAFPVDEGAAGRQSVEMLPGNDALGQVVDLLEPLPPRHGQRAGPPQVFQRGLLVAPVPPAAAIFLAPLAPTFRARLAKVPGHQRALAADALQDLAQVGLEAVPSPIAPAPGEPFPVALETAPPEGVEAARDDRGIMGPVFEQRRLAIDQPGQLLAPVVLVAGEQDMVMGPLHGPDAVDLDEAHALDQVEQPRVVEAPGRIVRQPLGCQEQAPRRTVRDHRGRGR